MQPVVAIPMERPPMKCRRLPAALVACVLGASCANSPVSREAADAGRVPLNPQLVVWNAKVVTGDERFSLHQALAVRDGKFVAVGTNAAIRAMAGSNTRVVDAGGRTVIPGLIDAHVHMFRAGFWWKNEVRVDEARTLDEILGAIHARANATAPGTWILTLGGWHFSQIRERRMPTREELDRIAPRHPVYIQALRDVGQMNSEAIRSSGITAQSKVPPGVLLGRDATGEWNGEIRGFAGARFAESLFPVPSFDDKLDGLQRVMRDFNAAGLTSVGEGTGFGVSDDDYRVLYEASRRKLMTVRVGLQYHANDPEQAARWIRHVASGFGDDWLRVVGLGEIVMTSMWDGFMPKQFPISVQTRADFEKVIEAGARNRITFQLHSTIESTMNHMLDTIESVHARTPVDGLRIALLHAEQITPAIITRMKRLGMGVTMQNRQALASDIMQANWGPRANDVPPVKSVYASGVPFGGGTDGTVSASYKPFISIWWLVSGRNWRGDVVRPTETLTREQALRVYTRNAAWFTFEEDRKGAIIPGFLADFLVLDKDYLTVPEDAIRSIRPLLTVVDGRIVHDALR
jgi:predicted amidohydrolase YtcJ